MQSSSTNAQIAILLNQAHLQHQHGKLREALALYLQVIYLVPENFEALHSIGILHGQLGDFEQALRFFTSAGRVRPEDFSVYYNQGKALQALNRHEAAVASYDKALSLKPDYVTAYNNRGNALKDMRCYEEAIASFDKALSLRPDYAEAYNNRANVLQDMKCYAAAVASYDKAIALKPGYAEAYYNRGNALLNLQRPEAALVDYNKAIAFKADYAEAYCNRGLVLHGLQRYVEALASYDKAIAFKSDYCESHYNRGNVLKDLERYGDSAASFDRAIAINPHHVGAHLNKGLLKLLLGEYETGWALHEWRWQSDQHRDFVRDFTRPLWLGDQSPAGRTILLHAEQGLGDTIQFVRYVPMVAALGARVILEVAPPLVPLLNIVEGAAFVIARGEPLPAFDLHCPLMSLPLAFKTTVTTIPADIPYLTVNPQKHGEWRQLLGEGKRPRIGLAWSGNAAHKNDRNRSIGLRSFEALLRLDCEFHSLHKEVRAEDQATLAEFTVIRNHEGDLGDFSDTAALIAELDLVITVDTSAAHLAGALGKEVWILLPYAADYRWMTQRQDSPWYPTARLFRQHSRGDWNGVILDLCSRLQTFRMDLQ